MNLITVSSASFSAYPGSIDCELVVEADGATTTIPYTYDPTGADSFSAAVKSWFADNPSFPIDDYVPAPAALPDLAPYQFRAMLKLSGMQSALESWIDGLAEPANTIARAKLEFSLVFKRDNDLVLSAQQVLGLTDQQLDDLWMQAHAIE